MPSNSNNASTVTDWDEGGGPGDEGEARDEAFMRENRSLSAVDSREDAEAK